MSHENNRSLSLTFGRQCSTAHVIDVRDGRLRLWGPVPTLRIFSSTSQAPKKFSMDICRIFISVGSSSPEYSVSLTKTKTPEMRKKIPNAKKNTEFEKKIRIRDPNPLRVLGAVHTRVPLHLKNKK